MLDAYSRNTATMQQSFAKTRHGWTDSLREESIAYRGNGWMTYAEAADREFVMWAAERAYCASYAMAMMGVTEADQFYA